MGKRAGDDYFSFIAKKHPPQGTATRGRTGLAPRPFKPADTGKFVRESRILVSSASDSVLVRCLKVFGITGRHDTRK